MVSASNRVEDRLKEELNLKYSGASRLIQEARQKAPDQVHDDDALIQVATNIFQNDLSQKERDELLVTPEQGEKKPEPEWQTKARLAAEKREQQWIAEEAGLPPPEEQAPKLPPNVVSQTVTKRVGSQEPAVVESLSQEVKLQEPNDENTRKTTCYCVLM